MKGRKHTPEQIVRKLREADRLLGEGQVLAAVTKRLEISEATSDTRVGRLELEIPKLRQGAPYPACWSPGGGLSGPCGQ